MFSKRSKEESSIELQHDAIVFKQSDQSIRIAYDHINEVWAENSFDFLGNRIVLCLATAAGEFRLTEGESGFAEAQIELHNHLGFLSDFYAELDAETEPGKRVSLFRRDAS